jgi:glycosyltransferase involved in cell wall biosynthesis
MQKPFNKIYINGRFLTQSMTGVQRYAFELLKALDLLIDEKVIDKNLYSFELLSPYNIIHQVKLKHIHHRKLGIFSGHLWEQFVLPYYSRNGFLLNLGNTAPLLKRKQVVTICDVSVFAVPFAYSFSFRMWYKFLFRCFRRTLKSFITISNFSKNEIVKYLEIDPHRIHVIYLGKEHIISIKSDDTILLRNNLVNVPFVLAVSSMSPHKNFSSIVRAIESLHEFNFQVLIVGGTNPKIFMSTELSISDKIIHLGYVNDAELKCLYEHAKCFIFPSFYEGFGLPPLEAMSCGCPVIVSNIPTLVELCGEAAVYCDPKDQKDIAEKIYSVFTNTNLYQSLRAKGYERVKLYSWKNCAIQTINVITTYNKGNY